MLFAPRHLSEKVQYLAARTFLTVDCVFSFIVYLLLRYQYVPDKICLDITVYIAILPGLHATFW